MPESLRTPAGIFFLQNNSGGCFCSFDKPFKTKGALWIYQVPAEKSQNKITFGKSSSAEITRVATEDLIIAVKQ